MLIALIVLSFIIGAGVTAHADRRTIKNLKNRPEPPQLDTPEQLINYLEACSVNNTGMTKMLGEFKTFTTKPKQLAAVSTVNQKPDWIHNPRTKVPCDEHWKIFLNDLTRETTSADKIAVVNHWMFGIKNRFTYKELEMMLDQFDLPEDRKAVRELYAKRMENGNG